MKNWEIQLLSTLEQTRLHVSRSTKAEKKSKLGQFFTSARIANFMAGLFSFSSNRKCWVLDAGAGIGSLSSAFLDKCVLSELNFDEVQLAAFELDDTIHVELNKTLKSYMNKISLSYDIYGGDFIEAAVNKIQFEQPAFTHAILNPPYKKINSNSAYRLLLRKAGIETVNLYSAFVALAVLLMVPNGQIVAIIPRSFCNGPYYRSFRNFILQRAAIRHIHLFESRSKAFKDDEVLQENIIIKLERGGQQEDVTISTSTDDSFTDLITHKHPFNRIVFSGDPEQFIHIPTSLKENTIEQSPAIHYSLIDLGLTVSTGPVVDFRLKDYLRDMPQPDTVPLLYPIHFAGQNIKWPKLDIRKSNAIQRNTETEKWLYPNGFYCVVRRFSSKEEKRRIVASVIQPNTFGNARMIGIENHLNVYHENKHGLPEALARGLAMYLNSTSVDENFRRSSGHTQVNATDLRMMKYPSRKTLIAFGEWAISCNEPTQDMIDEQLKNLIT